MYVHVYADLMKTIIQKNASYIKQVIPQNELIFIMLKVYG